MLDRQQLRAARDIMRCRTAALGGHLQRCQACGLERPAYNSCRNRHCPKCLALAQARWVARRLVRTLPVHHFHVVFTVPAELSQLAHQHANRAALLDLLMKSAARTLLALGRDDKWLGAQLGVTAVLHTWTRELTWHPHVHCIVTGGGLAQDHTRWVAAAEDFLFPGRVLGALFRGKVLAGLARLCRKGKLVDPLDDRAARRRRKRLYDESWVVYAKRPFGGAEQVFRYLGRYTHRVAISNARLLSIDEHEVVFRTRGDQTARLSPIDFTRRFLDHVLPPGFVKIRHFGLHASANVNGPLETARALLLTASPAAPSVDAEMRDAPDSAGSADGAEELPPGEIGSLPWQSLLAALTAIDLDVCPACHARAVIRIPLPLNQAARPPPQIGTPQ